MLRSVSENAALALAGLPPIDHKIKALWQIREGATRLEAYERLMVEWHS